MEAKQAQKQVEGRFRSGKNIKTVTKPVKFPNKKVHRNEPCSCGSGRKYKHCCEKKMIGIEPRHYHAH